MGAGTNSLGLWSHQQFVITQYVHAIYQALYQILELLIQVALPLALFLGLAVVALAVTVALRRDEQWLQGVDWVRLASRASGYVAVALLSVAAWSALRAAHSLARQDIRWRESAEATANPVPDAPPVHQFGPSIAALAERTYTRTLTLPPDFLERIGNEGVSVLSPYLSDPSAENVLRLVDTFRRSGRDVLFTRQVTRLDEEPLPITSSVVRVKFKRLGGRAFNTEFEGRYGFQNSTAQPFTARFLFPLPEAGTIQDLQVAVGTETVKEPNDSGAYEWKGTLQAGERREAVVRYRVLGARTWNYDLGSRRRRVQQFVLEATPGGPVRFQRGSLQPNVRAGETLRWELSNVVTAQQVGIAFPRDVTQRESYLQALTALPASFALFLVGVLALGFWFRQPPDPGQLAGGIVLFTLGLGASLVLTNYLGPIVAIILGPVVGAFLAGRLLGRYSLPAALPAALLPATFLSPQHSGLLVLILASLTLLVLFLAARTRSGAS
jgi:hypothetical protein